MDGVRLTAPTILNVKAEDHTNAKLCNLPTPTGGPPASVLLVVAQGGHKIAFHDPPTTSSSGLIHGLDPQILEVPGRSQDLLCVAPLAAVAHDFENGRERLLYQS